METIVTRPSKKAQEKLKRNKIKIRKNILMR